MEDSRYRVDTLSPLTRGLILADLPPPDGRCC